MTTTTLNPTAVQHGLAAYEQIARANRPDWDAFCRDAHDDPAEVAWDAIDYILDACAPDRDRPTEESLFDAAWDAALAWIDTLPNPLPDDTAISYDDVVRILRLNGYGAYVEQTGGGCATVFASRAVTDDGMPVPDADGYYDVAVGPGSFTDATWTHAYGHSDELYVGHDQGDVGSYMENAKDAYEVAKQAIAYLTYDLPTTDDCRERLIDLGYTPE